MIGDIEVISTERKVDDAIAYGKTLVGAPYRWWYSTDLDDPIDKTGAPFYCGNHHYTRDQIMKSGANCAGLLNLMAREIGADAPGGVVMWMGLNIPRLEKFIFSRVSEYPKGTILFRTYRSVDDQGHMGILIDDPGSDRQILHSYPETADPMDTPVEPGVVIEPLEKSMRWGYNGFYEYILKPEHWVHSNRLRTSFEEN